MVNDWFNKVNVEGGFIDKLSPNQMGKKINLNLDGDIDMDECDVVICSTDTQKSQEDREQFYQLYNHFENLSITDLGVFKSDSSTYIIKALKHLTSNYKVILLDAPIELTQFMLKDLFNDPNLFNIIVSESNPLDIHEFKNYDLVGYQKHKCSPASLKYLKSNRFNSLSLGEFRDDSKKIEPILRDTQMVTFHPNVTQFNKDFGIQVGFNIEESCQIMKYAGISEQVRLVDFVQSSTDHNYAVADLFWYFLEGLNYKLNENPKTKTGFQEYVISSKEQSYDFSFVKSTSTGRWWLKTPSEENDSIFLSCSEEEYDDVCRDKVPTRLVKYLAKL